MLSVTKQDAIDRIIEAARTMGPYSLVDLHNEIDPYHRLTELAPDEIAPVRRKVLDYLEGGIEIEEVLDFWRSVFPHVGKVDYDYDTDVLYYSDLRVVGLRDD